jgi:predicted membrane-bound spermidine synthase/tetratricopeptide (TPR) repeat protein
VKRTLLFYAISGFVSLGYQVAWFRIVTDWFGSTNLTFALVVATFIGGLALGALASRRVGALLEHGLHLGDDLRVYGVVELLVAATIALTFLGGVLPHDLLGPFPYREQDGIWIASTAYRALQAVTAAICVLVPCFFMGVTFPLLCQRFAATPGGARFPSMLYASNTLGACLGVVACQFLFLPWIGHDATLATMAGVNAVLGLAFVLAPPRVGGGELPAAPGDVTPAPAPAVPTLVVLVILGGFLAGAMEGDLFKRITFVIELNPGATMSFISFWAILAIFLASSAVHRVRGRGAWVVRLGFAGAALYALGVWPRVDAIRDAVEAAITPSGVAVGANLEGMRNLDFPSSLLQLLAFTGILVLPPYFGVSLLLPWACDRLQGARTHLGLAYGANTLAFCLGLLAFVLWLPMRSQFWAFKLFAVLLALTAGWLFLVRSDGRIAVWKLGLWAAAAAAAALLVPTGFDRSFFRPGSLPAEYPVRAVKSNGAHTTFVVDVGGRPRLFFGRLLMSSTNLRAQSYMRLMAHVPLLLHPDPRKALLICLGVGNTGSAIARHDGIERIDVVDLNRRVFETLPEFAATNGNLHQDPRVRFIEDDGRNFLHLTDERYDLITSEPPPPLAAGVYRLYSEEYYREVLAHLEPDGFMTQWLPLFLMTPEAVRMSIATFLEVFPHTLLFTGYGTDFVLLGSPSPIDPLTLASRFDASPGVRQDLAQLAVRDPVDLLARVVQTDAALRRNYGDAPRISDQRNDLEHLFLDAEERPVVRYEVADVLAWMRRRAAPLFPELGDVLTHLGRLRYHVQGYPFETLAALDPGGSPPVALAGIDWQRLAELSQENAVALRRGGAAASARVLESFLGVSDEQPEVLLQLARIQLQRGRADEAIPRLEAFRALEPRDVLGLQLLADARAATGRTREALDAYAELSRLAPGNAYAPARMAWILATHPDPQLRDGERALVLAKRATALDGEGAPPRRALAAALAANGRFDDARDTLRTALDDQALRAGANARERARMRRALRSYERGELLLDGR